MWEAIAWGNTALRNVTTSVGMLTVGSGGVLVGSAGVSVFEEAATSEWEIDSITQLLYK